MRIQHNIMAMNAYRNYNTNTGALSKNLEKLSSGYKINRAGDDAAGLAISEKMRAQITGLQAAQKNVKDGTNLVKTAEGAMQEIQDMLKRMKYLATQSANGTYDNPTDRLNLNKEVDALKTEINRIADSANFNGINLLDGSLGQRTITYKNAAKAYDVQSIQVMGGGRAAPDAGTSPGDGPKTDALTGMKATVDGTEDKTTVTLELKNAIKGIKWVAVGQEDGNSEFTEETTLEGSFKGSTGGSVTFKAVRAGDDGSWDDATLRDVEYYEGMTITVAVDAAERDASTGAFVGYGTDGLEADSVGKATGLELQIGDTADNFNIMSVDIGDMHVDSLGVDGINIADQKSAQKAISVITDAINKVSSTRGDLGAYQNRLDHTLNNLSVMTENIQDAESAIRDTDVAEEMMAYTKNNILIQSAQAMLAQANAVPQGVLQLLG